MGISFQEPSVASDYMLVRFAREGIQPSEYKRLTLRERASLLGILSGETKGFKDKRDMKL